MGRRIPINLTPAQTEVILAVLGVVVLVLVAVAVLELVITRGVALAVRLTGHAPPRKSSMRVAIDELEARLRGRSRD